MKTQTNDLSTCRLRPSNLKLKAKHLDYTYVCITKADKEGANLADAKAKTVTVGYNLGAVSVFATYSQLENITGTAGADRDVVYLAARTSF